MSKSWEGGSDSRWRAFRLTILDRDGWVCTLLELGCTRVAEQVHHITPLSRGGSKYDPANCTSACASCNRALGDRPAAAQPEPRIVSNW